MPKALSPALRNTGAVLGGLITVIVLTSIVDLVLHKTGVFPPMGQPMDDGLWALATGYRFILTGLGGWLTAKLALEPRMRQVWILTGIGTALGALGVASWFAMEKKLGLGAGPLWYPVAVAVTGPIASWWGGRNYLKDR